MPAHEAGAFTRHGVGVRCDFEDVPEIIVEKHKVLQILINLLRNAKYACEARQGRTNWSSSASRSCRTACAFGVTDNGVGILPEHMTRIFNHGFTTKKDGHGFGIHSGALAARDMGGALRVASEGSATGRRSHWTCRSTPPETDCA